MPGFLLLDQLAENCAQANYDCGDKGGYVLDCHPDPSGLPGYWYTCKRDAEADAYDPPAGVPDPGWGYDNEYSDPAPPPAGPFPTTPARTTNGAKKPSMVPYVVGGAAVLGLGYFLFFR